jgi:hypothetical protein
MLEIKRSSSALRRQRQQPCGLAGRGNPRRETVWKVSRTLSRVRPGKRRGLEKSLKKPGGRKAQRRTKAAVACGAFPI